MYSRKTGIILSYTSNLVNMVCGLVLSSFLIKQLGSTEYGIYQTITSFVNYLVLLEFGTGTVMTRNLSLCRGKGVDKKEITRNASTIWTFAIGLTFLILTVAAVFYLLIGRIYSVSMTPAQIAHAGEIFVLAAAYLLVSFLLQTLNGAILAFEHYSYASLVNIIRSVSKITILLLIIGDYPNALVVAGTDFVLSLVCLLVAWLYVRHKLEIRLKFGTCDREILRWSAPLCLAIFMQAIVNQVNNNVDKFIIGLKLSPESVTLYSIALYIFSVFSSLTTIPISMYAPAVTRQVAKNESMYSLFGVLIAPSRLTALIGGMVIFGFVAVGRQFVELMYGSEYLLAWVIAIVLMVPMYFNMITGTMTTVLDALNKRMIRSVALLLTTLANIVLTVFWLDLWGMMGAALATAVCTLLGQTCAMSLYYQYGLKFPIWSLYKKALSGILLCLILGCAAGCAVGHLVWNPLLSFLSGGVVFVAVTMGSMLLFGATAEERKALTKRLKRGK